MSALKCALTPLDFRGYPVTFTDAQKAELRAAFPTGVCDYNRRGVEQQRPIGDLAQLRHLIHPNATGGAPDIRRASHRP